MTTSSNPNRGHYDPPPTVTYSTGPRAEVDRVDAISCDGPAISRVGDHCVCVIHEVEVRLAYWATDSHLPVLQLAAHEYFQCGDVYTAPAVSR